MAQSRDRRGGRRAQGEGADGWAARRLVVAEGLVGALESKLGVRLRAVGALTGAQLAGCRYRHPLLEREAPVVVGGDYITTDSGTGLVHTAPGHGQEDYQARSLLCHVLPQTRPQRLQGCQVRAQVGLRNGLELLSPVDDEGVFTAEAGSFAGTPSSSHRAGCSRYGGQRC